MTLNEFTHLIPLDAVEAYGRIYKVEAKGLQTITVSLNGETKVFYIHEANRIYALT